MTAKKIVVVLKDGQTFTYKDVEIYVNHHQLRITRRGQAIGAFDTDELRRWDVDREEPAS
jgi:hypothetical protein